MKNLFSYGNSMDLGIENEALALADCIVDDIVAEIEGGDMDEVDDDASAEAGDETTGDTALMPINAKNNRPAYMRFFFLLYVCKKKEKRHEVPEEDAQQKDSKEFQEKFGR